LAVTSHALDIGAMTPFFWMFEEREKVWEEGKDKNREGSIERDYEGGKTLKGKRTFRGEGIFLLGYRSFASGWFAWIQEGRKCGSGPPGAQTLSLIPSVSYQDVWVLRASIWSTNACCLCPTRRSAPGE
jgi:hypothetical protein